MRKQRKFEARSLDKESWRGVYSPNVRMASNFLVNIINE